MDIESLAIWIRRSHITIGLGGLVAYWIPIFAKKGGRLHIISGRVFEWCGYYVAATALFSCIRYLSTPRHFGFFEDRSHESVEELARVEGAQFLLTVLAFLAIAFLYQLRTGMRTIRVLKKSPERYRNWEQALWLYGHLISAVALAFYGGYRLTTGGSPLHWVSVALGAFTVFDFRKELAFHRNPQTEKMSWWYKHMECMLGCGVAFHTAGFVFIFRVLDRDYNVALPPSLQFIPWLLPAIIGIPVTSRWIKHYRKKFGELGGTSEPKSPTLAGSVSVSAD